MKRIAYLFIYLFIALAVISCNKTEDSEASALISRQKASDAFFENDITNAKLEYIITYLKTINSEEDIISEISQNYGRPLWNYYEKNSFDELVQYLIPVSNGKGNTIESILVIKRDSKSISYGFISKAKELNDETQNDWLFDLFNQKIFGLQKNIYFDLSLKKNNTPLGEDAKDNHIQKSFIAIELCYPYRITIGTFSKDGTHCSTNIMDLNDNNLREELGDGGGWEDPNDPRDERYTDPEVGGGTTNPTITETTEFKKSIFDCIKNKIETDPFFKKLLENYVGDNSKMDLVFDVETLEPKVGGVTYLNKPGNKNFNWINGKLTINISLNSLFKRNATVLDFGYFFIHESMHAYLYYKYYSGDPSVGADFTELYQRYYKDFKGLKGTTEMVHQDEMVGKYIWDMAGSLMDFGKKSGDQYLNNKDINFYYAFILDSLRVSKLWESLPNSDQNAFHDEVKDYWINGLKDCK